MRGSLPVTVPTQFRPPAVEKAAGQVERLRGAHRDASRRVDALTEALTKAQDDDRRALAGALAAGKTDPGGQVVERVESDLRHEQRNVEALTLAVGDAECELSRAVALVQPSTRWNPPTRWPRSRSAPPR